MKILLLKGGLGNQLFILSYYLYLKKKFDLNIILEDKVGFLLDFKYHRFYELGKLPSEIKNSNILISLFSFFIIVIKKILPFVIKYIFVDYINDSNYLLKKNESILKKNQIGFIDGYFQDFRIVKEIENELLKFIIPKLKNNILEESLPLVSRIKNQKESIALCIRFYEESLEPLHHSNPNKDIKSIQDYNNLIKYFESKLEKPYFFIFVQEENTFTDKLIFNTNYEFITHKKGFVGSWNRMYLQSLCVNHIFNNSTFYYWGAFLASQSYKDSIIYMSDNFKYKNIYNPNWKLF
tara:strand:- start:7362 stop:8243 length:882 start_codon:yes stop_codon:yes gene_type:complete